MLPRIVVLSAFLTPFRSGAEACAEEVAVRLAHSYDIMILTARLRSDLPRFDTLSGGVRVRRLGLGIPMDKWFFPILAPLAARRLRPVIVHAVLETFAGCALLLCRWIVPGARRILTMQTTNRSFLKRTIVRSPHALTAISSALVAIARSMGRPDAVLIPNGIDLAALRSARETHERVAGRILFVGRLERMKGVDTLLDAFAQWVAAHPDDRHWHLRIVGDGSQRPMLERRATQLGLQKRVTFVGRVAPECIAEEYAHAMLFCGLSRSEALGNVFLEAQAAGCAVLATRVQGILDIVRHEESGLLIAPDDPTAASQAIERLIRDSALRERLVQAGIAHAVVFDWSAVADRYRSMYEAMRSR